MISSVAVQGEWNYVVQFWRTHIFQIHSLQFVCLFVPLTFIAGTNLFSYFAFFLINNLLCQKIMCQIKVICGDEMFIFCYVLFFFPFTMNHF
jgi:hypothetical protein